MPCPRVPPGTRDIQAPPGDFGRVRMPAIVIISALLLYLPVRLSRGFPSLYRLSILLMVAFKATLMVVLHFVYLGPTGHPIVRDAAVDAIGYYQSGEALRERSILEVSRDDLIAVESEDKPAWARELGF